MCGPYFHGGVVNEVDLIANQYDWGVVLLAEGRPNEGQPVSRDAVQCVLILHAVHHTDHIRPVHLCPQLLHILLTLW